MKLVALIALAFVTLNAQPAFEVASIKRGSANGGVRGGCHGIDSKYTAEEAATAPPLGRCVVRDGRLSHMFVMAYRLRSIALLTGGPDWVKWGDDRFNVEAKVEDPSKTTEEQLYQMLADLLIERFSVKLHRETKDVPGFALVVAKNGPKLKEAKGDQSSAAFSPSIKSVSNGPNTLTARKYTMPMFANLLTQFGPPVLNQTGLTSAYDFTLSWDESAGPALSTALQEQLGLKFEAQKVPQQFVVIDSAKKPTDN